jgi:VanZ family protein
VATPPSAGQHRSPLARFLFAAYALLVVYASLHPFAGWRDQGVSAFAFVAAPWPRYVTAFDLLGNILGYVPYGFLCVLALYPRLRGVGAFVVAVASGAALSLALEGAQTFLPARIVSNLDTLCNLAGATAGALAGSLCAAWLLERGPLARTRRWAFEHGAAADLGLVLLGLWLLTQSNPATLLFATGGLRDLLALFEGAAGSLEGPARAPQLFVSVEALTAAVNLTATALIFSALVAPGRPVRAMLTLLVVMALAVKTAAFAILLRAEGALAWVTPGALQGLAAGLLLAFVGIELPRAPRLTVAAVLLMAGAVLVNVAPPNPYLTATLAVWEQGHFLHFNGLTRLVSALWPYAMLAYLVSLASRPLTRAR